MASNEELACVYSALILQDNDLSVTADKIKALLKAANVDVEPYWPGLFASAVQSISLKDLVTNVGAGAPAAPAAAAAVGTAPAADVKPDAKAEEKEEDEDSDGDMGFGLFD